MSKSAGPAFGQITIFDIPADPHKRRPCEYSFKRYAGQRVCVGNYGEEPKQGKITKIEPYYTHVTTDSGKLIVGTPTNTWPEE